MISLESIQTLLRYSDWANQQVLRCAAPLTAEQLDRPFPIGRGSLRSTLAHIVAAEHVWLQRWMGRGETPWPREDTPTSPAAFGDALRQTWKQRDAFLAKLGDADLRRCGVYRDSKGSLFNATLGDMLLQGCIHSTHHRAQVVNMLRQLEAETPELDYMMWVRRPATSPCV